MKIDFTNLKENERLDNIKHFVATYKKGTYFTITYKRVLPTLKKYEKEYGFALVEKTTTAIVRTCIDYTNTQAYGNHAHFEYKPTSDITIDNAIVYNQTSGKYKVRVYTTNNHKAKTQYTLNGTPITKQELELMNIVSTTEFKPSQPTELFQIMLDNILSISYS